MTKQTIAELKELLEKQINQQLQEFKDAAAQYERVSSEADNFHRTMISIASELKSVEALIRLSDNTYPDLFDQLLSVKAKRNK